MKPIAAKGGDIWFKAFRANRSRHATEGFYDEHSTFRWRYIVREVTRDLAAGVILKTDCWNEALGAQHDLVCAVEGSPKVILLDISLGILRSTEAYKARINGALCCLPFRTQSIDCILDISTSDHCAFSEFNSILTEYARVLKIDGKLLLIHNSALSIPWRLLRRFGVESPAYVNGPPAHYFDPRKVISSAQQNGFVVMRRYYTNLFSWLSCILNLFPANRLSKSRVFSDLERRYGLRMFSLIARQHVLHLRRTAEWQK